MNIIDLVFESKVIFLLKDSLQSASEGNGSYQWCTVEKY